MKTAIIGGGIAGLTTALALHQKGLGCTVYEKAGELNEIGAGVWLQPNAVKILDALGIKALVSKEGMELDRMEITNNQLRPFREIKDQVVQDDSGNKTIAIHRGKLQKVLYQEVSKHMEVKLGMGYEAHETEDNGIRIRFGEGEASAEVVLGADGIQSHLRQSLFPDSLIRSAGQICWRGISNTVLPAEDLKVGREAWGKQIRFGFSQISASEVYWFAVIRESSLPSSLPSEIRPYLQERFSDFHTLVGQIISNTPEDHIHRALLGDLKRLDQWHSGNICLIGDAAHATTPNMGQGACQAIEDAWYLSQALAAHKSPDLAFKVFDTFRRKKVDYIVNNSWRFGKMAHSRLGQSVMRSMMKLTPEKVLIQQMKVLYKIQPLQAC